MLSSAFYYYIFGSQVKLIPKFFKTFNSLCSIIYVECASHPLNSPILPIIFSIIGFVDEHILRAISTSWTFKQYDVLYDVFCFVLKIASNIDGDSKYISSGIFVISFKTFIIAALDALNNFDSFPVIIFPFGNSIATTFLFSFSSFSNATAITGIARF